MKAESLQGCYLPEAVRGPMIRLVPAVVYFMLVTIPFLILGCAMWKPSYELKVSVKLEPPAEELAGASPGNTVAISVASVRGAAPWDTHVSDRVEWIADGDIGSGKDFTVALRAGEYEVGFVALGARRKYGEGYEPERSVIFTKSADNEVEYYRFHHWLDDGSSQGKRRISLESNTHLVAVLQRHSFSVKPSRATPNTPVLLQVHVPVPDRRVIIEREYQKRRDIIAIGTTLNGSFSFEWRPAEAGYHELSAKFEGSLDGARINIRVGSVPSVRISAQPNVLTMGQQVNVAVTVGAGGGYVTVHSSGEPNLWSGDVADRASFAWIPRATGSYTIWASFSPKSAEFVGARSNEITVEVR